MDREYQLCLKCHSSYTQLPSNAGYQPSQYLLDKAVEFNPLNASTHPVEGPGSNRTLKMSDSLSGDSPYKLWTFTASSTIRCTNCHANNSMQVNLWADQSTPTHVSENASLLILPYQDRQLKPGNEAYAASQFALCYACHTDAPFRSESLSTTATNFRFHWKHTNKLATGGGAATSIDEYGAGSGNAICSECHFRLHSTTYSVNGQQIPGSRLVNFAPNVQYAGGALEFTTTGDGHGTCTLSCHGVDHDQTKY
jgi:hypothetical protein